VNIVTVVDQSSRYAGGVIRLLYNRGKIVDLRRGCEYRDPYPHIHDPREKIKAIVFRRKWHLFYNPHVVESMIEFYETSEKGGMIRQLHDILNWVSIAIAQWFALWMITWLIPHPVTFALMTICLLLTREVSTTELFVITPLKIASLIWYGTTGDIVLSSFLSEMSDLLWNRGTWWAGRKLWKKIQWWFEILTHDNQYNSHIGFYSVAAWTLYHVLGGYSLLIPPLIPALTHPWLALYMLFGIWSHFYLPHMFLLSVFVYLVINVVNRRTTPRKRVEVNMIQSYYFEPRQASTELDLTSLVQNDYSGSG
jgi:hypothetical protein